MLVCLKNPSDQINSGIKLEINELHTTIAKNIPNLSEAIKLAGKAKE